MSNLVKLLTGNQFQTLSATDKENIRQGLGVKDIASLTVTLANIANNNQSFTGPLLAVTTDDKVVLLPSGTTAGSGNNVEWVNVSASGGSGTYSLLGNVLNIDADSDSYMHSPANDQVETVLGNGLVSSLLSSSGFNVSQVSGDAGFKTVSNTPAVSLNPVFGNAWGFRANNNVSLVFTHNDLDTSAYINNAGRMFADRFTADNAALNKTGTLSYSGVDTIDFATGTLNDASSGNIVMEWSDAGVDLSGNDLVFGGSTKFVYAAANTLDLLVNGHQNARFSPTEILFKDGDVGQDFVEIDFTNGRVDFFVPAHFNAGFEMDIGDLSFGSSSQHSIGSNLTTLQFSVNSSTDAWTMGSVNLLPKNTNTHDLGSNTLALRNIYTRNLGADTGQILDLLSDISLQGSYSLLLDADGNTYIDGTSGDHIRFTIAGSTALNLNATTAARVNTISEGQGDINLNGTMRFMGVFGDALIELGELNAYFDNQSGYFNNQNNREALGLNIGTDVQAYSATLDAFSNASSSTGETLVFDGTNYVSKVPGEIAQPHRSLVPGLKTASSLQLTIPDADATDVTTEDFTVFFTTKLPASLGGTTNTIIDTIDGGADGLRIYFSNANGRLNLQTADSAGTGTNTFTFGTTDWRDNVYHTFLISVDRNGLATLTVDGYDAETVDVSSAASDSLSSGNDWQFLNNTANQYFRGWITGYLGVTTELWTAQRKDAYFSDPNSVREDTLNQLVCLDFMEFDGDVPSGSFVTNHVDVNAPATFSAETFTSVGYQTRSTKLENCIYVAKNGTDTRTGLNKYDLSKPFLTCQAALDAATSGDLIVVYPGDYTSDPTISGKDGVNWEFKKGVTSISFSINIAATFTIRGGKLGTLYVNHDSAVITAKDVECGLLRSDNGLLILSDSKVITTADIVSPIITNFDGKMKLYNCWVEATTFSGVSANCAAINANSSGYFFASNCTFVSLDLSATSTNGCIILSPFTATNTVHFKDCTILADGSGTGSTAPRSFNSSSTKTVIIQGTINQTQVAGDNISFEGGSVVTNSNFIG